MLRAVVVGTGTGCITHVRALRNAGIAVAALVGRDPTKTADRAERVGVPIALTSLTDALSLADIDAVAVATPPHTHGPLVLEAVRAGKHVVCEKPFARDATEARGLHRAAEEAGVVHMIGTAWRWGTAQALATRAVAEGAVGSPRLFTFLLHAPLLAHADAEVPSWWADADHGGGWLGGHAPHVIDQVRATLGEFESVSASLSLTSTHDWTAEDSFTIRFRLTSGVEGVIQSTCAAWGPPVTTTRILGTTGTLWIDGASVWVADAGGTRLLAVPDDLVVGPPDPPPADLLVTAYERMRTAGADIGPFTRLYDTFRDLIDGEDVPEDPRPPTFADGVAGMAVLDAVRESSPTGRWVDVAPY